MPLDRHEVEWERRGETMETMEFTEQDDLVRLRGDPRSNGEP
jgi:hypothetical protein